MNSALSAVTALPLAGWSVHAAVLRRHLNRARLDPVTALPTRQRFTAQAARLLRHHPALVVLVDLDRFKPLNDTHGHAALQAVAARLAAWTCGGIAARIGGDEFAAILPHPTDPSSELATLHYSLTQPVPHEALRLELGASIGAHHTTPGTPLSAALHAADTAMYTAKHHGGGWTLAPTHTDPADTAPARWRRHRPAPAR